MELHTLKVRPRETAKKGGARRARAAGLVPAVLYGEGLDPISLETDAKIFNKLVHGRGGEHAIVQLEVEGKPELNSPALLKHVDHHPLRGTIRHADFQRIRLDRRIRTFVPVTLKGQSKGVIDGGVLDKMIHEVEVECLALEVPEEITFDVTELIVGDIVHVEQLIPPANVTIVTEGERTVATVHAPRVDERPSDAAAAAADAASAAAATTAAAPAAKAAAPAAKAAPAKAPAEKKK